MQARRFIWSELDSKRRVNCKDNLSGAIQANEGVYALRQNQAEVDWGKHALGAGSTLIAAILYLMAVRPVRRFQI